MAEIALVGPFTSEQTEIIDSGLPGHHVAAYPTANMAPDHSIIAVRGGVPIPTEITTTKSITTVISGGRGTDNIEPSEGLIVGDCRGVNGMETAAHAVALMLSKLNTIYNPHDLLTPQNISVGIIGPGFVGTNIALLMQSMGFLDIRFAQRAGKGDIDDINVTDSLDDVLATSDLLFVAAPAPGIINTSNAGLIDDTDLIVNIARGNTITPDALGSLTQRGNHVMVTSDVWHNEPRVGNNFPQDTSSIIHGDYQHNSIEGTMHQGGRQVSCNLNMAHMLTEKLQIILSGRQLPEPEDPITLYRKALSNLGNTLSLNRVIENASDVARVSTLKTQLNTLANRVLKGELVLWAQPAIIKPRVGNTHHLVQQLQTIHNLNY